MSLPADYGYVIMTGVGAIFMVMWKGIRVGKARKEHGVQYPDMYSPDNKVDLKTLAFPSCNNSVPRCSTVSSEPIRTPWRTCLSSCSSSPWVGQSQLPPSYPVTTFDIRRSLLSSPLCCCRLGLDCWQGGLCTRYIWKKIGEKDSEILYWQGGLCTGYESKIIYESILPKHLLVWS